MPSNIKIKTLARSAGKTVDVNGNPTALVSGSDLANIFLTGDIDQGTYRHVPDTVGSIFGTDARPIKDQYQFYEFDGKVPSIAFTSILTITDNADPLVGRYISYTYTTTGLDGLGYYNIELFVGDSSGNNFVSLGTFSKLGNLTNEAANYTDSLVTPKFTTNAVNTFKLVLTTGVPVKYAEDTTTIYIYPKDLIIQSVVSSSAFAGAHVYNYTTGSVSFTATVAGGVTPYYYNWNEVGYGSADVNTATYDNSATTTADPYTLTVKDSKTPTFDTATRTVTTFRAPIRVSVNSINSSPEPYVDYTIAVAISNNVDSLVLTYVWALAGTSPSTSTTANPTVYYTSTGSYTHRVNIANAANASIRHHTTTSVTATMLAPTYTSATYSTNSETFSISLNISALGTATSGTSRKFDIEYRLKDSGGSYGSWTAITTNSTTTTTSVAIVGKTNTAQVVQARTRTRRSDGTTEFNSSYVESSEVTIPIKGIASVSNQTNLLTGGNRTFDGSVTLGGVADTGFTVNSVSSTTTDSSVSASGTRPSSNILRISVNNPCTSVNDGTASHIAYVTDGNGYNITASFTTQYKINSSNIGINATWNSGLEWNNAYLSLAHDIPYTFTTDNFQFKATSGDAYANVTTGGAWIGYQYYSAPSSDQTRYYRAKSSGGTYTQSDYQEVTVTVYAYPNQGYGYSVVTLLGGTTPANSGTLSQVSGLKLRVARTSGNFGGIEARFDYTIPGGSSFLYLNSISDASITDTDTFFNSDLYDLYNASTFVTGVSTGKAILTYTFLTNKTYLHTLTNDFSVAREPGSLTVSTSGLTDDGYAIRGKTLSLTGVYTTPGPPTAALYLGYSLVYVNTDELMNSVVSGQTNYYTTTGTTGPYFRTNTAGGYGRYTQSSGVRAKTPAYAHENVTYDFYANTYIVGKPSPPAWTYYSQGDAFSTSVTYTVKGRRVTTVGGTLVPFGYPGASLIEGITNGTWWNNITGVDGAVDTSYDYLTYNAQYSSDNSTWTNLGAGISYYDPGTFGTTYFRMKVTDDWGTTKYSTSYSYTTRDWDYGLTLSNTNQRADVWYPGGVNSKYVDLAYYVNAFVLSETDPGAGAGTLVTPGVGYASYFYYVGNLDDSENSSFPGAYLDITTTAGTVYLSRIYQENTVPYYWRGNGAAPGYFNIKNSTSYNPLDITRGLIVVFFTTAESYGADVLVTIKGQKGETNTSQQKKYYFRYRTPAETNEITLTQISTSCTTIGVRARTGTLNTANKIIIQSSTDNSTWTDVHTITSIAANTNYDRSIIDIASTVYVRALLYQNTTLKTTSSTVTYTKYLTKTGSSYSVISLSTFCTTFSYRVDRGGTADSNTNSSYDISWYTYDEYGTTTLITSAYSRSYNTTYSGMSLSGFPCDTFIQSKITPYSITGCVGAEFNGSTQIYVSDGVNTNCGCASGGNTGCLVYGTKVLMYDGSYKNVEDLIIGDIVKSLSINGLAAGSELAWKEFSTTDFNYEEGLSIIYNIQDDSFNEYYVINNNLKVTFEHPIFIKRNDECIFVQAENLTIGDYLFKSNNEFEIITSIDIIDEQIQTININIEENDVYFGNDILVHNVAPQK
jgi:hypothetical protein